MAQNPRSRDEVERFTRSLAKHPAGPVSHSRFHAVTRELAQELRMSSDDLTRFVRDPFEATARFDDAAFAEVCAVAVRMLDNVLDVTVWPLPEQQAEAASKRRVGLGFRPG